MTVFFHTALKVIEQHELKGKHITTMFSEFIGEGKFSTSNETGIANIVDLEFWEGVGVVAIVDCSLAKQRYEFFKSMGYKYDFEYKPHITLDKTNKDNREKYKHLLNTSVIVGEEYFKPMYK